MKRFLNILAAGTVLVLGLETASAAPPKGRLNPTSSRPTPIQSPKILSPLTKPITKPTAPLPVTSRPLPVTGPISDKGRRNIVADGSRVRNDLTLPVIHSPKRMIFPTHDCPPPICHKPICRPKPCDVFGKCGRGFTVVFGGGYAPPVFEELPPLPPLTPPASVTPATPSLVSPPADAEPAPAAIVAAAPEQDVEVLEVKFVDAGDGEKTGPLYRVFVTNNTKADLADEFNVGIVVSTTKKMSENSPRAFVRLKGLKAGEVQGVDVRLPKDSLTMGTDADGKKMPFSWLVAVADTHEELKEKNGDNNLVQLQRNEIEREVAIRN